MSCDFDWLYARFPKRRPPLPPAYDTLYEEEYKRNRGIHSSKNDFKQRLEKWMHFQVTQSKAPQGSILEIGAGTLNHVDCERQDCAYDIVEPFSGLYEGQAARARLRNVYRNIDEIPKNNEYTKIISIAVLEHLEDLPHLIARSALLLRDDGVMAHGIPSEGGLLWYLAWRFGTGLSFQIRNKLSYAPLMHHEHVNSANEILRVLNIFFDEMSYKRFPLPFLHGSFYTYVELRKSNKKKAKMYLDGKI